MDNLGCVLWMNFVVEYLIGWSVVEYFLLLFVLLLEICEGQLLNDWLFGDIFVVLVGMYIMMCDWGGKMLVIIKFFLVVYDWENQLVGGVIVFQDVL